MASPSPPAEASKGPDAKTWRPKKLNSFEVELLLLPGDMPPGMTDLFQRASWAAAGHKGESRVVRTIPQDRNRPFDVWEGYAHITLLKDCRWELEDKLAEVVPLNQAELRVHPLCNPVQEALTAACAAMHPVDALQGLPIELCAECDQDMPRPYIVVGLSEDSIEKLLELQKLLLAGLEKVGITAKISEPPFLTLSKYRKGDEQWAQVEGAWAKYAKSSNVALHVSHVTAALPNDEHPDESGELGVKFTRRRLARATLGVDPIASMVADKFDKLAMGSGQEAEAGASNSSGAAAAGAPEAGAADSAAIDDWTEVPAKKSGRRKK